LYSEGFTGLVGVFDAVADALVLAWLVGVPASSSSPPHAANASADSVSAAKSSAGRILFIHRG